MKSKSSGPDDGAGREATLEESHIDLVRLGAAALDEWRHANPGARLDLTGADLRRANLSGLNLTGAVLDHADLRGADLSSAELTEASLMHARLEGADLHKSVLYHTLFVGADLRNADLSGSAMYRTSFKGADLTGADISRATKLKVIWPHTEVK
jgi:uncharacterized protein YjbI with pentapeptide repeats